MKEEFLSFLWKNRLYKSDNLQTSKGESVEVFQPGFENRDAGPDFSNAKIRIGENVWAGNVEIHVRSSDWNRHKHSEDKSYDSVILQVVAIHDCEIFRSTGHEIPTLVLTYDSKYLTDYERLAQNQQPTPCHPFLHRIDYFVIEQWKNRLLIERLEDKSKAIEDTLAQNINNWEETFYIYLAKSFGFNTNSLPFELLAKSLPQNILAKHKDKLFQIEALLFGVAGFLNEDIEDSYYLQLQKEYKFLQAKYQLVSLELHLWKFLRLRPNNFPTIRIAQFAALINKSSKLFSKILEYENFTALEELFSIECSPYWDTHYNFGKVSDLKQKQLGDDAIRIVLINTVFVFLFTYGKVKQLPDYQDRALSFFELCAAEDNAIIKRWRKAGVKIVNAFDSQAILQLDKKYCSIKKCLACNIGSKLIMNHYISES